MKDQIMEGVSKAEFIAGVLEQICQAVELSDSQHTLAKSRYEAVGEWLARSDNPLLNGATIYPQGSVPLGTTVKPLARNEYDVDLVCFVPRLGPDLPPAALKYAIGERLRQNGRYNSLLEEMPRCWRLNFANEFHLDITPSIKNPQCSSGGELVPDKKVQEWKASNPRGYRKLFEERAKLAPRLRLAKGALAETDRSSLEPFPARMALKGILRRAIQLGKRHRDLYFAELNADLSPISVIITTLAAKSYAYCVASFEYDTELDLLLDVFRFMPGFVEHDAGQGPKRWFIWNETTDGENFSEKWNTDPRRAKAFFEWHAEAESGLEALLQVSGLDRLTKSLRESFGEAPVSKALTTVTESISSARKAGRLSVAPGLGLVAGTGRGATVRANTFFGAD